MTAAHPARHGITAALTSLHVMLLQGYRKGYDIAEIANRVLDDIPADDPNRSIIADVMVRFVDDIRDVK